LKLTTLNVQHRQSLGHGGDLIRCRVQGEMADVKVASFYLR
jgi:hypothetical protein